MIQCSIHFHFLIDDTLSYNSCSTYDWGGLKSTNFVGNVIISGWPCFAHMNMTHHQLSHREGSTKESMSTQFVLVFCKTVEHKWHWHVQNSKSGTRQEALSYQTCFFSFKCCRTFRMVGIRCTVHRGLGQGVRDFRPEIFFFQKWFGGLPWVPLKGIPPLNPQ